MEKECHIFVNLQVEIKFCQYHNQSIIIRATLLFCVTLILHLQTMFCKRFGMFLEAGTSHFLNFFKSKGKTNALIIPSCCNILKKSFQINIFICTYKSVDTSANLIEKHSTLVIPNFHTKANKQLQVAPPTTARISGPKF